MLNWSRGLCKQLGFGNMHCELQAASAHSSFVLLGDRFLCLKYCVTCWGSSANTDLAKVSFGACENNKNTSTSLNVPIGSEDLLNPLQSHENEGRQTYLVANVGTASLHILSYAKWILISSEWSPNERALSAPSCCWGNHMAHRAPTRTPTADSVYIRDPGSDSVWNKKLCVATAILIICGSWSLRINWSP